MSAPTPEPGGFVDDELGEQAPDTTAPAAEDSALANIRARRDRAKAALITDLEVPRYDPPVYVRFKPASQGRIDAANTRARQSKDKDATVAANAMVLADCCLGVFELHPTEVDDDGKPLKISIDPADRDGEWPKFDKRLAQLLGVPAGKASEVVRGLYLTDGDVISTSIKLAEWSGFAADQMELDEGN